MATGLSLIWGIMRVVNWAHGAMVMLAMYFTFFLHSFWGLDPLLSLPLVAALMFVLGYLLQIMLMGPILQRPFISKISITFGLMIFLESLALFLWGSGWRSVRVDYGISSLRVWEVSISVPRLISFVLAMIIAFLLFQFLNKTEAGRAMRATAQNQDAASLMGANPQMIFRITFGIGLALTGVAGSLLMTFYYVFPTVGFPFALTAYIVVVLGGLGNLKGAILGGLILGVAESMGAYFFSPALKSLVSFGIFMFVLYFRPEGLFGGVTE